MQKSIIRNITQFEKSKTNLKEALFKHGRIEGTLRLATVVQHRQQVVHPEVVIRLKHLTNVAEHILGVDLRSKMKQKEKGKNREKQK